MLQKIKLINLLLALVFLCSACNDGTQQKTIGIIVPIEHKALNEIIAGFTETLKRESPIPLKFKIANAQGDLNLQQAIINQMKNGNYAMVVPVGTTTTLMTAKFINNKPIVSLAAVYTEEDRKSKTPCNITAVHDEVSPAYLINFIHALYPTLKHLTLIHSANEKVYPEIKVAQNAANKVGIEIKPLLVPSLNELYSIANALPKHTEGVLVLKDSLIASGISTLVATAKKQQIPLITSDQGTVEEGASFALGVTEKQIGIEGASVAKQVLAGKNICDIPMQEVKNLQVFVNKSALANPMLQQQIAALAAKNNYGIKIYD